jgi:choline dehydrogenase
MDSLRIKSVVDLPGVGQNLQDHGEYNSIAYLYSTEELYLEATSVSWAVNGATWWDLMTNDTLQAEQLTQWRDDATGLWTYINEAVGMSLYHPILLVLF